MLSWIAIPAFASTMSISLLGEELNRFLESGELVFPREHVALNRSSCVRKFLLNLLRGVFVKIGNDDVRACFREGADLGGPYAAGSTWSLLICCRGSGIVVL